jgi:hypothetical protein
MRKHTVKQSLAAGLTALGLMAAAGCGGGDDDGRRSTTTESTTPESTAPPTTSAEEGVEADYLAAVAALQRVSTTTVDPADPELTAHFVDPALSEVRTRLSTWQAAGMVVVYGDMTEHRLEPVTFQGAETALVIACIIGNDVLVTAGTPDVTFPEPETERRRTTMVRHGDAWAIQSSERLGQWEGIAGCAAEA